MNTWESLKGGGGFVCSVFKISMDDIVILNKAIGYGCGVDMC